MLFGIFTYLEVLFFSLGVLSTLAIECLIWLRWKHNASWGNIITLGIGLATIIVAIAWSVSAVLEGEPQAGSMGMMVMFVPGMLIASVGGRKVASALRTA